MNNIYIYYGPKKGFELFLEESGLKNETITSFSELVRKNDDARRELRIISTAEEPNEKEVIQTENLVAYSDEYASVREHVILNFDEFFSSFIINNAYFHNPPVLISSKIKKSFPTCEIKQFEYPRITEETILQINNEYDKEIIGQPDVKKNLLISLIPLTRNNYKKPIVILLYGPSGVGKTESAKFIAEKLGSDLFRKQLSMFQSNEFLTYFFGGHHYENSFAKELLEREINLILLDEFDKANQVFYSAFYQLFDEGIFVDKNYHVEIGNPIIICTSNYTSLEEIRDHLGDPIFSRFDACIKFNDLQPSDIKAIVRKRLKAEYESLNTDDKQLIDFDEVEKLFDKYLTKIKNARRITKLVREVVSSKILDSIMNKNSKQKEE